MSIRGVRIHEDVAATTDHTIDNRVVNPHNKPSTIGFASLPNPILAGTMGEDPAGRWIDFGNRTAPSTRYRNPDN